MATVGVGTSTIKLPTEKKKSRAGETKGGQMIVIGSDAYEKRGSGNTEKAASDTPNLKMGTYINGTRGTSTDYGTYKQDLDRLTQAQRQAQIDELKAARTQALANLDAQEQNIKPTYQNARNLTSASSQQGARNFAEYLSNRGLTNSGAAAQAEINRQSNLINNLGNINQAEANAYRDIANQRTAVENNYVSGLANANNALTNNYYNNLLNHNEQQRQQIQALQNQANYQYYDDIQAQINNLLAQGYAPNSYEVLSLEALRGQKAYGNYNNAMANASNNILAGNINYNTAAQLGMTVPQAYDTYNRNLAAQEAQSILDAEARQREIDQQQWKNNLDYEKYLLDKEKVANDTAMTNYNINKPYYKPTSPKATTPKTLTDEITKINKLVSGLDAAEKQRTIDALYNAGEISDAAFDYYQ